MVSIKNLNTTKSLNRYQYVDSKTGEVTLQYFSYKTCIGITQGSTYYKNIHYYSNTTSRHRKIAQNDMGGGIKVVEMGKLEFKAKCHELGFNYHLG